MAVLLDSGCDATVVPEGLAKAVGLNMEGKRDTLYAYRESAEVVQSKAKITLLGRMQRDTKIFSIPVLVTLPKDEKEDSDVVLGINGIFDYFDITFSKSKNKIIFKEAFNTSQVLQMG